MSATFDYITGKKSGREAELEASLEHMGGYLGIEIEDNEKLRAEIERLAAENEKLRTAIKWALGEQPDSEGQWFSEERSDRPEGQSRRYWWRSHLRKISSI